MEIPLIAIGVLVVLVLVYAVIVIFLPGFKVPAQKLKASADFPENDSMGDPQREEVAFEVEGDKIHAWFYPPADTSGKDPCVVLGHGLGGTKACGLGKYASRFQQAGFAALAFDYRFFGESGGEPRQLIWIPHQLEDYRAAIAYARQRPEVDPDRIAVWGSSFSGGHAIGLASQDRRIACVASQVPGLDPHASLKEHFSWAHAAQLLRLIPHGQRENFRAWLDLSPHRVPLVGKPGTVALMTSPQAHEQFPLLTPDGFVNEACARIIVRADKYRPVKYARDVECPVLLQICDRDELVPVSSAQGTIDALGKLAEVRHYPIGHFDIYFGEHFEQAVRDQIAFFKTHLIGDRRIMFDKKRK